MDVLEVGMEVQAKLSSDGMFYPATVRAISKARRHAKAPVRVKFTDAAIDAVEWKSFADLNEHALATTIGAKDKSKSKRKTKTMERRGVAQGLDSMSSRSYRISESISMREFSHDFTVQVTMGKCGAVIWIESCGGSLFMANSNCTFKGFASEIGNGKLAFHLKGHCSYYGVGGEFSEEREFRFTGNISSGGLHVDIAPLAPPSYENNISRPRLLHTTCEDE